MHAPPKSDIPVVDAATLEKYDAFLFGIPTRYGNFPAQWKTFWDTTGRQVRIIYVPDIFLGPLVLPSFDTFMLPTLCT